MFDLLLVEQRGVVHADAFRIDRSPQYLNGICLCFVYSELFSGTIGEVHGVKYEHRSLEDP